MYKLLTGDAKDPFEHFVSVDPITPDISNVEEAAMPCMEIVDSDDESDDDIDVMGKCRFHFLFVCK